MAERWACRRRRTASAALPLLAAPDAQRSAPSHGVSMHTRQSRHTQRQSVLDDPLSSDTRDDGAGRHDRGKVGERPCWTTPCYKTLSWRCLTTGCRHCRLGQGTRLLPVVTHPPRPCSMTRGRHSPPARTLDGILSASTGGRACLTPSGGDPAGRAPEPASSKAVPGGA
jgi:hypothetical protein